jgi:hypothetical protein
VKECEISGVYLNATFRFGDNCEPDDSFRGGWKNVIRNAHSGSSSTVTCAFRLLSVLGTTEESVLIKCMYNEQCQMNGSARVA